jgi:peroxiredoxin
MARTKARRRAPGARKDRPTPRRDVRLRGPRRSPVPLIVVLTLALGGAAAGAVLATRSGARSGVRLPGGGFVARPGQGPANGEASTSGEPAPEFRIRTVDGRTMGLADVRGKPTVLFFMAYWCGTCLPEARALGRIQAQFADRVQVIAVDVDPTSSRAALREFANAAGNPPYTFAFDEGGATARAFQLRTLDTTIVIDPSGRIVYRDGAPTPYETLLRVISPLAA